VRGRWWYPEGSLTLHYLPESQLSNIFHSTFFVQKWEKGKGIFFL